MITKFEIDSYEKYAHSFWSTLLYSEIATSPLLQFVKDKDKLEVAVAFSIYASHLEYADNFRIRPIIQTKEFWDIEKKGCCGSWNSQVKTKAGNIYWIGCNYGH